MRHDRRNTGQSPVVARYHGDRPWAFRTGKGIFSTAVIGRYDARLGTSPITFGSGDEFLYQLRTDRRRLSPKKRVIWKYRATERCTTGQIVNWWEGNVELGLDGTLYAGNTGGCAYAVNPDGTLRWTYAAGNSVWTDAARGDDGTTYWGRST